jgi:2-polyprenyl-6-methoxyphenol hydroxylase-like FAD-dependent oxidoreductase
LGVHRASLCHVLDTALADAAPRRWFGCEVNALEQSAHEVRIDFQQGGQSHRESFDAVVVANGSASRLRPSSLVRHDREYPWGAMWMIRPLPAEMGFLKAPHLQQRYGGSVQMAGALPTGFVPGAGDTPMVSFFWSLPVADMAQWRAPQFNLEQWKQQVLKLWPELSPLILAVASPSELTPATYRDVILSRWATGRIGIIGDAAHAMSPQLGQGTNMALLDASALAQAVQQSESWEEVWREFHHARVGSIRFYQRVSRALTPFFQSKIPGASLIRDAAFPMLDRVPWIRQHMAHTVAGTKTSWL